MDRPRLIGDLADELLSAILSFLVPGTSVSLGRDCCENHRQIEDHAARYGERTDLDRFRLVCKRFMRIGTPQMFSRFVLKFSNDGFKRLECLLNMQLACHTRYFTYMVRPFYRGRGWKRFLDDLDSKTSKVSELHRLRLKEQNALVESGYDLKLLKQAMTAFTSLQQVKLLRLQDEADEEILEYIRARGINEEHVCLDWEPACSRAVTNLAAALLESSSVRCRFIGPHVSPEAALKLLHTPKTILSALATRLTCLDVNFHSTRDISPIVEELSGVFHTFFTAARNLVTVNLSFPAKLPLDRRLEAIFHRDVRLERLSTLGIQGWRLTADEIIDLFRRHRDPWSSQLRHLRLRSIYLRDGSRWRDVLAMLHDEMRRLERVDLRDVDYCRNFDSGFITNGIEVHDLHEADPPQPPLPSSLEVTNGDGEGDRDGDEDQQPLRLLSSTADNNYQNNNNNGPYFPTILHQERHWCPELYHHALGMTPDELISLTADELGDNGTGVTRAQRLLWEAWVISSERPTTIATGT
ncbi:hypothetical protein VTN02DRAFT_1666 [Thermoascus thermophilus]